MWRRLSKLQRLLLFTGGVLGILCAMGITLLVRYWPFGEKNIVETLEEVVPGTKVSITHFHSTYFVHPGCWAEAVTFVRPGSLEGTPPLATVQKVIIQAAYHDLFFRPGYISRMVIDGLHVQVPPRRSSQAAEAAGPQNHSSRETTVGEIVTRGTLLEIGRRDGSPLKFEIHEVKLGSVGAGKTMFYSVSLQNPLPPGGLQASGRIGPWNGDFARIPLSGTYQLEQANLGAFQGLAGTLSSTGRFDGRLGDIDVSGETNLPDFSVRGQGNIVRLKAGFDAQVNGTNGDVRLTHVNVTLENTPIQVRGDILGKPGSHGKTTSLNLSSTRGRVQDILRPFVEAPSPPMSGPMSFRAHVTFPSGKNPFVKRVNLAGDFSIDHGRFNEKDTQNSVDGLSARGRGIENKGRNPENVETQLTGHVVLSNAVANFSNVVMNVPGAKAQMNGTFNVVNERIDFHGLLKTDVKLSDTTHGIKAVFLKPLDPLFKRKSGGASIPVEMTGTYSQPHFGMEVIPGKH